MAAGAATRDHALAQVVAGADRAARLVEQLLTLVSRCWGRHAPFAACGLRGLAAEAIAELVPQRSHAGSRSSSTTEPTWWCRASPRCSAP